MLTKHKRITDRKMIAMMRKPYCEYCRGRATGEPHHVFTRGSGGGDIRENLVQLCGSCHTLAHDGGIHQMALVALIARREGKTKDEIVRINRLAQGREID